MKYFLVLSLLCAGVFGDEWNSDENKVQAPRARLAPSRNRSDNSRSSEQSWGDWDEVSKSNSESGWQSLNFNNSRGSWGASSQQWQHNDQQSRNNDGNNSSPGGWASYPEAASFGAKIQSRLASSRILSSKPEDRKKIQELMETKFNTCKGLPEERERACLGRATGQLMGLVSAVENYNRNAAA